jgi:hypothetical protein
MSLFSGSPDSPGSPSTSKKSGSPKKRAIASSTAFAAGPAPGSPRSTGAIGLTPEDRKMWKECIKVVRSQLGDITGNVAITMGGTHGQINVNTQKDVLHESRTEHKIPPFVDIPRGHNMFQILAAPFTVPHYGDDENFKKQFASSKSEMTAFLETPTPTPEQVISIADKMKRSDDILPEFLKQTLPEHYDDSDSDVRSKLEKVATSRGIPVSYTAYRNVNVADACSYPPWNIGTAATKSAPSARCNVPLLNKTYLLTWNEYREARELENEWKFTLYYLGKGGKLESFNILKALIRFAPITKQPDMAEDKKYELRQAANYLFISTQNIIDLVHDLGFTTQLHVDVTCNVIRDGVGRGLRVEQEKTMRRDLNLLYIPHQLAIQNGTVSYAGLDATLRKLLVVKIADGGGGGSSRRYRRSRQARITRRYRRRQRITRRRH